MTTLIKQTRTALRRLVDDTQNIVQRSPIGLATFRFRHHNQKRFHCPICDYRGPFRPLPTATSVRPYALCPKCGAYERHRLQFLVMKRLEERYGFARLDMLHFAPEPAFRKVFGESFHSYATADLNMPGVDHRVDITELPFENESFDVVYASHVLEHIPDDRRALAEIRRVLRPCGFAVLPVPIVAPATIEYDRPNPLESGHIRAPGLDYLKRYEDFFARIERFTSTDFIEEFQLFTYKTAPDGNDGGGPSGSGSKATRLVDIVPICHVDAASD